MREGSNQKPLWTCKKCGQSFVGRNMSHSCCQFTEQDFFAGRAAQRELYHEFRAFVERFGPIKINISKTRISFQGRARFVSVNRVTRDGLACHIWLKRRLEDPRFTRIEHLPPGNYVHHFKLTDRAQLDSKAAAWIAEAYEVGMQCRPGTAEA